MEQVPEVAHLYILGTRNLRLLYRIRLFIAGVANLFEARVQQKEKSKLRGRHRGNTSDWPLLISAAYQHPRIELQARELIDCYS